ncbi:hypothetical protein F5Y11DRAFT_265996 [Daldinia sp. FL1419]|nr:hypothetical protein F5Y11DRAFT_265996 [Daldinia sp. FL1419]
MSQSSRAHSYAPSSTASTHYSSTFSDDASVYSNSTEATQYSVGPGNQNLYNPFAGPPGLPCEFVGFGCNVVFELDQTEAWIEHIISSHLGDNLPSRAVCWFCDDWIFDSRIPEINDRRQNLENRLRHIRQHFLGGQTVSGIRPDFHMVDHLRRQNLIADATYQEYMKWNDLPCRREEMRHVRSRNFVPPEREQRRIRAQMVLVDTHKDEREWKKAQKKGKERSSHH